MKRLILAAMLLAVAACAAPYASPPTPTPTNVTEEPCVRTAEQDCIERWDDGRPK